MQQQPILDKAHFGTVLLRIEIPLSLSLSLLCAVRRALAHSGEEPGKTHVSIVPPMPSIPSRSAVALILDPGPRL